MACRPWSGTVQGMTMSDQVPPGLSGPLWSVRLTPVTSDVSEDLSGSLAFVRDHYLFLVTTDERLVRVLPERQWHVLWGRPVDAVLEGFVSFGLLERLEATRPGKHVRSRTRVLRLGQVELEGCYLPSELVASPSAP